MSIKYLTVFEEKRTKRTLFFFPAIVDVRTLLATPSIFWDRQFWHRKGWPRKKCMEKGGKMNYCFVLFPPFILYSFTHIHAIYLLLFFAPGEIYTVSVDMIREQLFIDNSTRSATTSLYKVHHEQKENLTHSSISPWS